MTTRSPSQLISPVHSVTVLEVAYAKLRGAIMKGELRPGQRLVETELAAHLLISRPTLREVFRRLESDRLIEIRPNRGSFVALLSPQDIDEIEEVWGMLTGQAVYRFTARCDSGEIALIDARMEDVLAAAATGDLLGYIEHVNQLFGVVLHSCGNRTLADTIRRLVARINFLRAHSMEKDGPKAQCTQELMRMVVHIRRQKPDEARAAAQRHIAASCRTAKNALSRPLAAHNLVA